MVKLSATIITLNEEKNLKGCLGSIKNLADEIIVVDSGSTDNTVEIAKQYKVKVFFRKFDNFANQKNFAISKASAEWILAVDADEVISPELAQEIKQSIALDDFNAYLIPRRNFIWGKEIKHTRFSPDKHIWLFKRAKAFWQGDVHEEVVTKGLVGELKNPKIHYAYQNISEFMKTNDKYAQLRAEQLFREGTRFNPIKFVVEPIKEFLIRFIFKLGFLDGWQGFLLSVIVSYYYILVWKNILSLQIKKQ